MSAPTQDTNRVSDALRHESSSTERSSIKLNALQIQMFASLARHVVLTLDFTSIAAQSKISQYPYRCSSSWDTEHFLHLVNVAKTRVGIRSKRCSRGFEVAFAQFQCCFSEACVRRLTLTATETSPRLGGPADGDLPPARETTKVVKLMFHENRARSSFGWP